MRILREQGQLDLPYLAEVVTRHHFGERWTQVDELKPEIARLLAAKEERRKSLSRLPYPEKVQVVIRLQRRESGVRAYYRHSR